MNILTRRFLTIFIFLSVICFSQNKRDHFIADSIVAKSKGWKNIDKNNFDRLLKNIIQLEKDYNTVEPQYRFMLLESAYSLGEISFFKAQLTILVEKYGFHVPYMREDINYYKALMNGELSEWFKEMYLEKHVIWLKNNFDKQKDLFVLNTLNEKDQFVDTYASNISSRVQLDSVQKEKHLEILSEYFFKNASVLYDITQKWKAYPTAKSFALIQKPITTMELHNMQSKHNFNQFYLLFFDYYKKAYLNNDDYYITFDNLDFRSYIHNGYSLFRRINKKDIPEYFWRNKDPDEVIPIKDIKFSNQIIKEFKWY